jgi:hypothetical protein
MHTQIGISEQANPSTLDDRFSVGLANNVPNGDYDLILSGHRIFPVDSMGTYTIHLVSRRIGDAATIRGRQLTLVYIPTIYAFKDGAVPSDQVGEVGDLASNARPNGAEVYGGTSGLIARIEALERRLAELADR